MAPPSAGPAGPGSRGLRVDRKFGTGVGVLPDGSLNLEPLELPPLFTTDDDFLHHLLRADTDPATGLISDPSPPFALYPANFNHVGQQGNPFAELQ